jgi:Protein of unknown function (DUF2853)
MCCKIDLCLSHYFHSPNYITTYMSKLAELIGTYTSDLEGMGVSVDGELLGAIAKSLGPSIYNADSSMVSCSDQVEIDRVKANFLTKKLGRTDDAANQAACEAVCKKYESTRRKRVVFYYLLCQHLGVSSL